MPDFGEDRYLAIWRRTVHQAEPAVFIILKELAIVFVSVSTECFPDLPLDKAMERLAELEFTAVELDVHEGGSHLQPADVLADPEAAVAACSDLQRLRPVALSFVAPEDGVLYEKFDACCRLAKALGIVTLVVESSELGTPFNGEIERLRKFVAIAASYGMLVGVKTAAERMTQDAETTASLCRNVPGLGVTLDPSHSIYGQKKPVSWDSILPNVCHVHLRDTKSDAFQVRVGQGSVEYGRIVSQLSRVGYKRALGIHLPPLEGIDQVGELRKMRLLLETLV